MRYVIIGRRRSCRIRGSLRVEGWEIFYETERSDFMGIQGRMAGSLFISHTFHCPEVGTAFDL